MSPSPAIKEQVSLKPFNTMGLDAKARFFVSIDSFEELQAILSKQEFVSMPKYVLGGGSNVLFVDDFEGLIIYMNIRGRTVVFEDDETVRLKVGAGENWHDLVMFAVDKGWGGIENLSLIPGSVGAAPIQNIGAYGVELEEVFHELEAVEVETGKIHKFNKVDCNFGYRDSTFKQELKGKYIITSVTLTLKKDPKVNTSYKALESKLQEDGIENPGIKEVSRAVIEIRESKLPDPAEIGNTGSFFKNPVVKSSVFSGLKESYPDIPHYQVDDGVKIPAAWLIDQCGWKGKRFGDAGVHKMQALVIVNYGNATGREIWNLAKKIQQSVVDKFGIALLPEVNIVGK